MDPLTDLNFSPSSDTALDIPAQQQTLCALRLTDLIQLCLGTFRMSGFAETWQVEMKGLSLEMCGTHEVQRWGENAEMQTHAIEQLINYEVSSNQSVSRGLS